MVSTKVFQTLYKENFPNTKARSLASSYPSLPKEKGLFERALDYERLSWRWVHQVQIFDQPQGLIQQMRLIQQMHSDSQRRVISGQGVVNSRKLEANEPLAIGRKRHPTNPTAYAEGEERCCKTVKAQKQISLPTSARSWDNIRLLCERRLKNLWIALEVASHVSRRRSTILHGSSNCHDCHESVRWWR